MQLNNTDPWTEVDGERSSLKTKHPTLSDPEVRKAIALLVDNKSIQDHIYGRTGPATAYEMKDGSTSLPLRFDPSGSMFVIFRKAASGKPQAKAKTPESHRASARSFWLAA